MDEPCARADAPDPRSQLPRSSASGRAVAWRANLHYPLRHNRHEPRVLGTTR
jgi:hypothetical protein